jgi:hypothetical protein
MLRLVFTEVTSFSFFQIAGGDQSVTEKFYIA